MSERKRNTSRPDSELQEKIRELLSAYRSQEELARRLNGPTQQMISTWLSSKRHKKPDSKSLVSLGNAAAAHTLVPEELAYWFWERAGLDFQAIRQIVNHELRAARSPWPKDEAVRIPLFNDSFIASGKHESERHLLLPAAYFLNPANTVCLEFKRRPGSLGSNGDLFIVDRSMDFPIGAENLVAVHFEHFPSEIYISLQSRAIDARDIDFEAYARAEKLSRKKNPRTLAKELKRNDDLAETCRREAEHPGVAIGWLSLRYASGQWDASKREADDQWRVVLQSDHKATSTLPLTEWEKDFAPLTSNSGSLSAFLRPGVTIFGGIVGWIKSASHREGNLE